jgi:hypothetical protein
MEVRELLYKTITEDPTVIAKVGADFVFQRSGFTEPPRDGSNLIKRFIVYHANTETGDPTVTAHPGTTHIFWVWCHDEPGDYFEIDEVLKAVRRALEAVQADDQIPWFLEFRWLETSIDLDDPEMFTICRYCRIQAVTVYREDMAWES